MLASIMNHIDSLLLTYNEPKRDEAKERLKQANKDLNDLKEVRRVLRQAKAIHCPYDEKKFKGNWINLDKAEALLKVDDPCSIQERTKEYEKLGTLCATITDRMNERRRKVSQQLIKSGSVPSL